jgi:hypothetical protein
MTINGAGRVVVTIGLGVVPDFIDQGFGFKNDGSVCIETGAPGVVSPDGGLALAPNGAIYGTTAQAGTDVWLAGVRVSSVGLLVYEQAVPASFDNGNPKTAAGNFAVS